MAKDFHERTIALRSADSTRQSVADEGGLANLSAVAKLMVSQHAGQHGFGHGHAANTYAWIVAAFGTHINFFSVRVNRFHFGKNRSCLLYTSPSPRDATLSRMPSSA